MIGCNYLPASAINQLEMWQASTFDPQRVELELKWAADLGMTVMRVFLHDILWCADETGMCARLHQFLQIADSYGIKIIFVLFDSCWHPLPVGGDQPAPAPGIHNSGWVQSPGARLLCDCSQHDQLQNYVSGVIGCLRDDPRVLAWDLWNEPDNQNEGSYGRLEAADKLHFVSLLLPDVFKWARSANPSQPLTSGLWAGDWSALEKLSPIQREQVEQSDIISFHNYASANEFEERVKWLQVYGRPILCTEYMARCTGSTFEDILPVAKRYKVAAINWGFVQGKSQTHLPWDSWQNPYVSALPTTWFHEIFHQDGTPYRESEVALIKQMSGKKIADDSATLEVESLCTAL